ncbi:hypothetical protein [Nonomuraea sp. NPDC048826]|uniref:hypothetical protein n=1 Tax=Nonomuraea sp. NPDC048826 TaxID=3364347 RepID=UPI003716A3A4
MKRKAKAGLVSAVLFAASLTPAPVSAGNGGPTPEQVCGSGFGRVADGTHRVIDGRGVVRAHVHLLYSARTGENCVVTIKSSSVGEATWTSATLYVQTPGRIRSKIFRDEGAYKYYAGPVKAYARDVCVAFTGTVSSTPSKSSFFGSHASGGRKAFGNCGGPAKRNRASG